MKKQFEMYLIDQGYSVRTPSGNPSTVYDYIKRVDNVCEYENLSWTNLADQIPTIVSQYDVGGVKEEFGKKSHSAVINALRRFQEFINETRK